MQIVGFRFPQAFHRKARTEGEGATVKVPVRSARQDQPSSKPSVTSTARTRKFPRWLPVHVRGEGTNVCGLYLTFDWLFFFVDAPKIGQCSEDRLPGRSGHHIYSRISQGGLAMDHLPVR
jgi:hypothetical protein